jgi:glucose-6-phosphate isomerase
MKRWLDPVWTQEMKLEIDFNLMMSTFLGGKEGITEEEVETVFPSLKTIYRETQEMKDQDQLPFLTLPFDETLVPQIKKFVQGVKSWAENFVVLGIGGSALGAKALQMALNHPEYNLLSRTMRKGFPRIFVADNIDPDGFKALLDLLDIRKTLFNVISKSGGTAETMSQFLIIRDLLKKKLGPRKEKERLVITTDPEKGVLRTIVQEEQFESFEIPPLLGGRFSVFSAVGLLPAAMAGIDVEELLAGVRDMNRRCQTESLWENPAYLCAALAYLSYRRKRKNIRVVMPYADALKGVGEWFCQLWAESLGKRLNSKGKEVWVGQTPVTALGATDQHSQLQLYQEGPPDKVFSFVGVKNYSARLPLPKLYPKMEALGYLGGHSLNELIQAEMTATRLTLAKEKRPSLTLVLPRINPYTLGQLMFLWELETYLCGHLLGVNPLDQPGVEEGKNLAYALMGRKGYEDRIKEWGPYTKPRKKYVL